jgi:hypothetical protein
VELKYILYENQVRVWWKGGKKIFCWIDFGDDDSKYILIHINGKMRSVETIPRMGVGGIKENDGGGEFNYDIL